ncbi:hypothetical protein N9N67_10060 [Bacteriovoracaceae bacterium]|nr:hypothetical protein [Bacteriovoracaceae bacterium]
MNEKKLVFKPAKTDQDIANIVNHTTDAFVSGLTSKEQWSLEGLKDEAEEGWEIFGALCEEEVVAAVFIKYAPKSLLTKNTPIKLEYQGNGFSHIIKEFYEDEAITRKADKIINYCPSDNFRMISLNEGHKYEKTGNKFGKNNNIDEWEKHIG